MKEWYQKDSEKIIEELESNIDGLSNEEAKKRLEKYGLNELSKNKQDSVLKIFFAEFNDPIIYLLIVAIIVSFIIGETVDALAITAIITIDAIIGTIQECKASKSAAALQDLIKVNASVLRNGVEKVVGADTLVPGDIVVIEPGNKISADLRIIESKNLTIDESILTGESVNSVKNSDTLEKETGLADRTNMLYAGTSVITGRAKAIVVAAGEKTEIGKIADTVNTTASNPSPLEIRMAKFSKQITLAIGVASVIIAIILLLKGFKVSTVFLSVVALGVSAMPEGLPLALTMALTIGSNRMAKKNVIVKKLNSVESLGSCTIIASDKTGTLTINQQTAKKILLPDDSLYDIEGIGYNDEGNVIPYENAKLDGAQTISLLGVLNNEAELAKENDEWNYFGDSIDVAFLSLGKKLGIDKSIYNIIGSIPYESENKYSAVFYEDNDNAYYTAKGSTEKILSFCTHMICGDKKVKLDTEKIIKQNESLAKEGYRVIAVANADLKEKLKDRDYNETDLKNMNFIGLVAFIDPIRKETPNAVKECKDAGIRIVMITGDHPLTAYKIAKDLEIVDNYDQVANGDQITEYLGKSQNEFDKFISKKNVFTRVTPIQKLEIVNSFIRQGEFIAVTGDGVNDAPAIKTANIGIAMGSGTDVAKETSDMIIIDDNFNSIVEGVKEGRNAYSNIRKVTYFLISCGLAEVLFFVLSIAFDLDMPLVAIQLLWLNVVTDGLQDLALSFELCEDDVMKRKPTNSKDGLFNKLLISEICTSGTMIGLFVFGIWFILNNKYHMDTNIARGYIMALMVFIQNIHVFNCRSERSSVLNIPMLKNPMIIFSVGLSMGLQILVMEIEKLSEILSTVKVPYFHMLQLLLISLPIILLMELFKKIRRHKECNN